MLQRFRVSDACERLTDAIGDYSRDSLCNLSVVLNPVLIVSPCLARERDNCFVLAAHSLLLFDQAVPERGSDDFAGFHFGDGLPEAFGV